MAVTKKIEIDGKEVTFKASAAVPRLYRIKFGRDIYKDLRQLEKSVGENDEDNSNLDLFSLEMFEDLAWLMARHADPAKVPDSPEEFLDQFNTFSIYQVLPRVIVSILLLPVVVGISYEFIRIAGKSNNWLTRALSWPGLQIQRITTREPDASQIECAIAALKPCIPEDMEDDKW